MESGFINKGEVVNFGAMISYTENGVVSKQILKNDKGNITLFSFDKGQGLSEHSAPFDAMVQIIDGEAEITIGGNPLTVRESESVIMPADIPHKLQAIKPFKMLLTMIKG